MNKGKTIRISDDVYEMLRIQLSPMFKLSKFVEQAIIEKLERELKKEKVAYSDNFKPL